MHDWDDDYSVSVFTAATGAHRKSLAKQRALDELLNALPQWANKARTFEDDMVLEISDAARVLIDSYSDKAARLMMGDFSALTNAPINASVVESMRFVVDVLKVDPATIGAFFQSKHFAAVPSVQLSARLFSTYKQILRLSKTLPDPTSQKVATSSRGFSTTFSTPRPMPRTAAVTLRMQSWRSS